MTYDPDATDQPSHYADRKTEVIDVIREALGCDGFRAYCRGNVIKYACRAGEKGSFEDDMRKAANYARWASGEEWRDSPAEKGVNWLWRTREYSCVTDIKPETVTVTHWYSTGTTKMYEPAFGIEGATKTAPIGEYGPWELDTDGLPIKHRNSGGDLAAWITGCDVSRYGWHVDFGAGVVEGGEEMTIEAAKAAADEALGIKPETDLKSAADKLKPLCRCCGGPVACGRQDPEEKWAPDVYPCGPWEDDDDGFPIRRVKGTTQIGAWVSEADNAWFWVVSSSIERHRRFRGAASSMEDAKAQVDARLRGE